ncbi:MAG: oxygen-independent coproporphyrinogen III oxidase, partial [Bacteriovorax sp.]|nr:oxygen-independent coproporphyrinogen III oxidase [Bacteriovorax sp.]
MKSISELINKYNRPGPRYTSYPPVPFWNNSPNEKQWISHLRASYKKDAGVDLYVHVPFCESLCYYCGCNRIITKSHDNEKTYLVALLKEWEIYQEKMGFPLKVNSLHFGGGTPTFLSPENLELLIVTLLQNKSQTFIGSIEIDPRTCSDEHLDVLARQNIKRVSLGIQDFDPYVQKAINRDQSPAMVETLVDKIRSRNFSSINFDLIYGLPKQSLESISKTIEIVAKMKPDLIAFYSYAHLPEKIKNQRLIVESELPTPELKRELYELGKKLLIENGYKDIGMDHFALPTSFLYKAMVEKKLHRNFMGYVDKKSSILIGLGPSSISDSSLSFIQNIKDVRSYEQKILSGELPIEIGHTQTSEDLLVQDLILQMMCHNEISVVDKVQIPFWNEIENDILEFSKDGIVEFSNDQIKITSIGAGFVRNVAMSFDF